MTWSAQYRGEAVKCLAAARATERNNSKALLLLMADAWVRLADQVEVRAQSNAASLRLTGVRKAHPRFDHRRSGGHAD
jgi:hypothetical protein